MQDFTSCFVPSQLAPSRLASNQRSIKPHFLEPEIYSVFDFWSGAKWLGAKQQFLS